MLMGAMRTPVGRMGLSRLGFLRGMGGLGAAETAGGGNTPFASSTARTNTNDPSQVYYQLPSTANQSFGTTGMTNDQNWAKTMPGWYVSGRGFPYYKDYQGNPIAFNPNDPLSLTGWMNPNLTPYAYAASDATATANDAFDYPYNSLLGGPGSVSEATANLTTVQNAVLCNNFNITTGTSCSMGPGGDMVPIQGGYAGADGKQYMFSVVPGVDWTVPLFNGAGQVDANYNVPSLIPPDVAAAFGFGGGTANVVLSPAPGQMDGTGAIAPAVTAQRIAQNIANIRSTGSYVGGTPQTSSAVVVTPAQQAASTATYNAAMTNYGTEQAAINASVSTTPAAGTAPYMCNGQPQWAQCSTDALIGTITTAQPSATDVATANPQSASVAAPPATTTSTPFVASVAGPTSADLASAASESIIPTTSVTGSGSLMSNLVLPTTQTTVAPVSDQTSIMDWISTNPLLAAGIAAAALFMFTRE